MIDEKKAPRKIKGSASTKIERNTIEMDSASLSYENGKEVSIVSFPRKNK
jgi:hypothetical protein